MPRVPITELSPQLRDYTDKLEYSVGTLLKVSAEYAEAFLKKHQDLNTENKMSDSPSNSEGSKGWVDWNKRAIADAPLDTPIFAWSVGYNAWICVVAKQISTSSPFVLLTVPADFESEEIWDAKWWLPMFEAPSDE